MSSLDPARGAPPARRLRARAHFALAALVALIGLELAGRLIGDQLELDRALSLAPTLRQRQLQRWSGLRERAPLEGLLLGLSTLREGVDHLALERALSSPRALLSVDGSGGHVDGLVYLSDRLLADPALRARWGVLLLHPMWLTGWAPALPTSGALLSRLRAHSWLLSRWTPLSQRLKLLKVAGREAIHLDLLGRPLAQLYPPLEEEQWFSPPAQRATQRSAPAYRARQLAQWRQLGKFDEARYRREGHAQGALLLELIAQLRARVDKLLLIEMPEAQRLRSALPPLAGALLAQLLDRAEAGAGAPVTRWSARALLPDEAFYDYAHMNREGRQRFTAELLKRIRAL